MRPVVRLVERRSRDVRLSRAEVDFLLSNARSVIDVVPSFERGKYRLTPRGVVGFLDGPTVRYAIRPKLPWPNLLSLLGSRVPEFQSSIADVGTLELWNSGTLLVALARELAARLDALTRSGLVAGYREQDSEAGYLRGRLRTADQLRDAASRAFPDTFQITESVFDLDVPWNRIPKAIAGQLLLHPDLSPDARRELAAALTPFAAVSDVPVTDADFEAAEREPRVAHYAELLRLSRLLHACGSESFLIDLGRAFEEYLSRALVFGGAWSLDVQPRFPLGPVELQPDFVVRRRGVARAVLDAKWKTLKGGPEADDVHQVLAYSAITGADRVGLVYPGKRFGRQSFMAGRVRVTLFRVQVIGPLAECAASVVKLVRAVRRK
ncbi:MAG TPA: hypothetical protein VMZ71_11625 [Gemmataceae bacterium]|nr:hypothetical protein [Gemmataceae bacterium]